MTYPISHIAGIDDETATRLKKAGIRSTGRLLKFASSAKGRKILAEKTGIDIKKLLCWANGADRMRIKGISREYAELLQAVGVDTVRELKYRNPAKLAEAMAATNRQRKLVRLLPSQNAVARWIEDAKNLPPLISY